MMCVNNTENNLKALCLLVKNARKMLEFCPKSGILEFLGKAVIIVVEMGNNFYA